VKLELKFQALAPSPLPTIRSFDSGSKMFCFIKSEKHCSICKTHLLHKQEPGPKFEALASAPSSQPAMSNPNGLLSQKIMSLSSPGPHIE